jgi:hypothetical protein
MAIFSDQKTGNVICSGAIFPLMNLQTNPLRKSSTMMDAKIEFDYLRREIPSENLRGIRTKETFGCLDFLRTLWGTADSIDAFHTGLTSVREQKFM